jgi:hypothetical protein
MNKDEALNLALKGLKLIESQDQGCGGNVTEAEAWRSAKSIAWNTIKALEEAIKQETNPQPRTWVGLMRGVRVEGDTVVISVKGGNATARELCGALIEEKNNG